MPRELLGRLTCAGERTKTTRATGQFARPGADSTGRCSMVPVDPFDKAADCVRSLQTTQDPARRLVLSKLRDLWIAIGNERSLIPDDELANDIERLRRVQSELTGVC